MNTNVFVFLVSTVLTTASIMATDIAQLKQLQAGLNAAFDSLFSTAEQEPKNASGLAASKSQLAHLAQATFGAALGPVPSILGFSLQVRPLLFQMQVRD